MGGCNSTEVQEDRAKEVRLGSSATQDTLRSLKSASEVARRMRQVLDNTHRVLGEPPLPLYDMVRVVSKGSQVVLQKRQKEPDGLGREAYADGARPPNNPQEAAAVALFVHHAQLVYESDTDVVRDSLKQCGMQLLQHNKDVSAGRVANYLAIDPTTKQAVLAIKGTSTIEDAITDVIADTEPLHDLQMQMSPLVAGMIIYAHGGFKLAAHRVIEQIGPLMDHFLVPMGYRLVVTGHSLGAGTACCVSKILHDGMFSRVPAMLSCYAYATPPCLSLDAALSTCPYVVSVVHHDDIVTRASLNNVKVMGVLGSRSKKLIDDGTFEDADHLGLLRQVQADVKLNPKDDMYVAGRVLFLFKHGVETDPSKVTYGAAWKDGTLINIRRLEFSETALTDHLCTGYIDGTAQIAASLMPQAPKSFCPWPQPVDHMPKPEEEVTLGTSEEESE